MEIYSDFVAINKKNLDEFRSYFLVIFFLVCIFWTVHKIVFVMEKKFAKLELGNYSVIASLKFELHLQLNYGTKLSDLAFVCECG